MMEVKNTFLYLEYCFCTVVVCSSVAMLFYTWFTHSKLYLLFFVGERVCILKYAYIPLTIPTHCLCPQKEQNTNQDGDVQYFRWHSSRRYEICIPASRILHEHCDK